MITGPWRTRLTAVVAVAALVSACSGGDGPSTSSGDAATQQFDVILTSAGCEPADIEAKTGPATFTVTNRGAAAVTEFEILEGDRVIGEVENIVEGLSGKFTLDLRAGEYTTFCPGGDTAERGTLTVSN